MLSKTFDAFFIIDTVLVSFQVTFLNKFILKKVFILYSKSFYEFSKKNFYIILSYLVKCCLCSSAGYDCAITVSDTVLSQVLTHVTNQKFNFSSKSHTT